MNRFAALHDQIERWFGDSLASVDPRLSVVRGISWNGETIRVDGRDLILTEDARLIVIAIGKAAPAMAQGAVDVLGDRIDVGVVLTKTGSLGRHLDGFLEFETAHPIPDEGALAATREILRIVGGLTRRDVVFALISGGGSALLELPQDGVSLEDMQVTTRMLMHAGAGIHDLNAVRRALSTVKGGGFRRAIGDATCVSLLLSDVLGNDPHVIASGPTVLQPYDVRDPPEVVKRFGIERNLPRPVREILWSYETPAFAPDSRDVVTVIADNETLVRELARLISADGLQVGIAWRAYDGDARDLGRLLVETARAQDMEIDVLIGGGEATVEVTGSGKGGRNTETALVAAMTMEETDEWIIASLTSDGDDGMADATGAIADPETIDRARSQTCDATSSLADNDSATFFRTVGGLVVTGPTGTNVNDVYIAVRMNGRDRQG